MLFSFFEKEAVHQFVESKSGSDFDRRFFYRKVEFFKDSLPDFESEILQIINTTNQDTIDTYFNELKNILTHLQSQINSENFNSSISAWNEEEIEAYNKLVKDKENEYFQREERARYKHLEKYEVGFPNIYPSTSIFGNSYTKKVTNYNFYCIEEESKVISAEYAEEYYKLVKELASEYIATTAKYDIPWSEGNITAKPGVIRLKPIIFFEGKHDITYVERAAKLLEKEGLLDEVHLKQRGSSSNLNKLWTSLTKDNWETDPQIKVLIYDCDTNANNDGVGHVFKRIIPTLSEGFIQKGIENLLPEGIVRRAMEHKKAFVDVKKIEGTRRGEEYEEEEIIVNGDEKKNFCSWICDNATSEDFTNFSSVFDIIEDAVTLEKEKL